MSAITLERYRWPYAAARACIYLSLLAMLALLDPIDFPDDPLVATTSKRFELRNSDIVVRFSNSTYYFVGTNFYEKKDLHEKLRWLRSHNPESRLVLRANATTPIREVREILSAARAAGYARVVVETQAYYPFWQRRMSAGFKMSIDRSQLNEPPDEGTSFSIRGLWY